MNDWIWIFPTELGQLTGVAAILRFPMPELEDEDDDESNDEDEND